MGYKPLKRFLVEISSDNISGNLVVNADSMDKALYVLKSKHINVKSIVEYAPNCNPPKRP